MRTHKNQNWIKVLAALSALNGGPGGKVAGAFFNAQQQADDRDYNQQMQRYQQQTQQAQQQQQTQQRTFENNQQTAQSGEAFLKQLAGLDSTTQEQQVKALTPDQMQAYGYTPDSLKAQFYDDKGNFVPVGSEESASARAANLKAQSDALTRLYSLTPQAQQALHDGMDADTWNGRYPIDYKSFVPGQLQKEATAESLATSKEAASLSDEQYRALTGWQRMNPQMQAVALQNLTPDQKYQMYGIRNLTPGLSEPDTIALLRANNAETDAQRKDATTRAGQTLVHGDRRLQLDLEQRGQNLRQQQSAAALKQRQGDMFLRYGPQGKGNALQQFDALMKQREAIQKRMTFLATPGKPDSYGDPVLPPRDQGRLDGRPIINDPNGQPNDKGIVPQIPNPDYLKPLPNAQPSAAYTEYQWLMQQDKALNDQQFALQHGVPARPASPAGVPLLPPLPPSGSAAPAGTVVTPAGNGPLPPAPVIAGPNGYTAHTEGKAAPGNSLTPQQIHAMPTGQLLNHLAAKYGSAQTGPLVSTFHNKGQDLPYTVRPTAPPIGTTITGTVGGQKLTFSVPRNQAEFLKMPGLQQKMYLEYLCRQKGQ